MVENRFGFTEFMLVKPCFAYEKVAVVDPFVEFLHFEQGLFIFGQILAGVNLRPGSDRLKRNQLGGFLDGNIHIGRNERCGRPVTVLENPEEFREIIRVSVAYLLNPFPETFVSVEVYVVLCCKTMIKPCRCRIFFNGTTGMEQKESQNYQIFI